MSTKNVIVSQKTGLGMNSAAVESGAFDGEQVGEMYPSVIQTIEEAPGAADSSNLYYNERYGKYNQPSFQRRFGVKNMEMGNVDTWGQNGFLQIDENIFWQGPCVFNIKVETPYRYAGLRLRESYGSDLNIWCGSYMSPQFFYSHGAGYAALQEIRMNQGGGMNYVIDCYSNFHAIMASCMDTNQRYALMKLSGGGLKYGPAFLDGGKGLGGRTEDFGMVKNIVPVLTRAGNLATDWIVQAPGPYFSDAPDPNIGHPGDLNNQFHPPFLRVPVRDNWLVAIKTPHTNFNNPKIRRRPVDTSLLQEPYRVEVRLTKFDYICDSGANAPVLITTGTNAAVQIGSVRLYNYQLGTDLGLYRQFYQLFPFGAAPLVNQIVGNGVVGNKTTSRFVNPLEDWNGANIPYAVSPRDPVSLANIGPLLSENSLPSLRINSVISSLKLTNSNLGAFNFLSAHSSAAVYYPYQHFVSQKYLVANTQYGGMTMQDYIALSENTRFPPDDRNKSKLNQYINIVCNPMTAMYIGVYREKDRVSLGVSKLGGYSPCLFWNSLQLTDYSIKYGSEPLEEIRCHGEVLMNQTYEHGSTLQVPYLGGCVSRDELQAQKSSYANGSTNATGSGLYYPAILRTAYLYEFSMTEVEPLKNEAYLQQTPSFLGESLTFSFNIKPDIDSTVFQTFSPGSDVSFLDDYSETAGCWGLTPGTVHNEMMYYSQVGVNAELNTVRPVPDQKDTLLPSQKGPRWVPGCIADPWVLNNDANLLVSVTFAQNALWQMNPTLNQVIFGRG